MIEQILNQAREKMRKSIEITRSDLASIRSGRASSSIVENIVIFAYGGSQKLKLMEMATINTPDAKSILVSPYDLSQLPEIEKGISEANIGLTPVRDGEVIRIAIPPLSQERRMEYIKLAKTKLENGRIMVRQVRQEAMKDLKKGVTDKEINDDDEKHAQKLIQELTDEMVADLDSLGEKKEEELMQI